MPVSRAQLDELSDSGSLNGAVQAFVANGPLKDTFGIGYYKESQEEAELAALQVAGVWALAKYGERLIAVIDASKAKLSEGSEAENGGVTVSNISAKAVVSWFSDDQEAPRSLLEEMAGLELDDAWQAAQEFMSSHDLAWHTLSEI